MQKLKTYQPIEGDSKVRKIIFNEVTLIIAIVGIAVGVMNWVNNPVENLDKNIALIQKDISVINTNHLTHLQNYAAEITDIKRQMSEQNDKIADENVKIEKMITLLEQHMDDMKR